MDSGVNGDSFLAPRLLPTPDETGDYQWPTFCSYQTRFPQIQNPNLTSTRSHTSYPNPHHALTMVLRRLSNRRQGTIRHRNLRRSPYSRRLRESLDIIREAVPHRRKPGVPSQDQLRTCTCQRSRMALA